MNCGTPSLCSLRPLVVTLTRTAESSPLLNVIGMILSPAPTAALVLSGLRLIEPELDPAVALGCTEEASRATAGIANPSPARTSAVAIPSATERTEPDGLDGRARL